jgi:hypothetical protein
MHGPDNGGKTAIAKKWIMAECSGTPVGGTPAAFTAAGDKDSRNERSPRSNKRLQFLLDQSYPRPRQTFGQQRE